MATLIDKTINELRQIDSLTTTDLFVVQQKNTTGSLEYSKLKTAVNDNIDLSKLKLSVDNNTKLIFNSNITNTIAYRVKKLEENSSAAAVDKLNKAVFNNYSSGPDTNSSIINDLYSNNGLSVRCDKNTTAIGSIETSSGEGTGLKKEVYDIDKKIGTPIEGQSGTIYELINSISKTGMVPATITSIGGIKLGFNKDTSDNIIKYPVQILDDSYGVDVNRAYVEIDTNDFGDVTSINKRIIALENLSTCYYDDTKSTDFEKQIPRFNATNIDTLSVTVESLSTDLSTDISVLNKRVDDIENGKIFDGILTKVKLFGDSQTIDPGTTIDYEISYVGTMVGYIPISIIGVVVDATNKSYLLLGNRWIATEDNKIHIAVTNSHTEQITINSINTTLLGIKNTEDEA